MGAACDAHKAKQRFLIKKFHLSFVSPPAIRHVRSVAAGFCSDGCTGGGRVVVWFSQIGGGVLKGKMSGAVGLHQNLTADAVG